MFVILWTGGEIQTWKDNYLRVSFEFQFQEAELAQRHFYRLHNKGLETDNIVCEFFISFI